MPAASETAAAPTRGARRRERTRALLLAAARTLFARQGADATTIAEITAEADVGFGSFYNHFESKDEIVEAVLLASIDDQGATVDALTADLADPAEVLAVAHRHFVRQARSDPDWGWLVVRLDASHDVMARALGKRARRDLRRGIASGRFDVGDPRVALVAMAGALLGVMHAVLSGGLGRDADVHHAEAVLRIAGLDRRDAAQTARRELPLPARGD